MNKSSRREIMKTKVTLSAVLLILLHCVIVPNNAIAAWSTDPTINNAISTEGSSQDYPLIVRDSSGGAIIIWEDLRNGNTDIYAQRINAAGVVQWTVDGVAVSAATGEQSNPTAVSDGSGGAIITWQDTRNGNWDIYAQRINASGVVHWTANGVAVSIAGSNQERPTIVSDGSGGAIITWQDYRNGNNDIYAQSINAGGTAQWTLNGVAICTETHNQTYPTIVSDGSGGAIITWQDARSGNWNIYAQRINAGGTAQWTSNGVAICIEGNHQTSPIIVSDGNGGAIITWDDSRGGGSIYAQRVDAGGNALWTSNGVVVSAATDSQYNPAIVEDGSGGAIITWMDYRNSNNDIYAQRINATGVVQWTADGVAISTAASDQEYPTLISDGNGGAIITWDDSRSGEWDIYAQRINATGVVQWTADGVAVSAAAGPQRYPAIVTDGNGGAIITWEDYRNDNYDVYAQRVDASGALTDSPVSIPTMNEWGIIFFMIFAGLSSLYYIKRRERT